MIPAMQVVDERRGWQVAAHAHEIEALQLGLACDDKALPSDDRFDIRACPGDYRVALIGPVVSAETTKHRFDSGSRRVAPRAGAEGAISIARGRAARGSETGRVHVRTPVNKEQIVCPLLLEKKH